MLQFNGYMEQGTGTAGSDEMLRHYFIDLNTETDFTDPGLEVCYFQRSNFYSRLGSLFIIGTRAELDSEYDIHISTALHLNSRFKMIGTSNISLLILRNARLMLVKHFHAY